MGVHHEPPTGVDPVAAIYRRGLPQVYGYLLPRCGNAAIAEDLTAETFLAAVAAARKMESPEITVAWLIGVARHKLVDHWRRTAREAPGPMAPGEGSEGQEDPWEECLDADAAHRALSRLSGPQRAALVLRYLDSLPVTEVAEHLGRSLHATETLLVRARAALRRVYVAEKSPDV